MQKFVVVTMVCFVFCKVNAQWTLSSGNEILTTGNVAIGSSSATNFALSASTNLVTNTVSTLALFGYSLTPSNRSLSFEQLGSSSTATQYFFLNGGLGSNSVLGSPYLTSAYAPSFGMESSDNNLSILAASAGTNVAPIRAMTFLPSGNVLVGKTSQSNSSYLLDVNGNGRFNQLVVNSTGADYVFDAEYKLPSLQQLETYIKANHHLPGIQPADEMQKNGMDVGGNQTVLLEKIEQLTLYVVQQNKKILSQQKRIDRLEKVTHQKGGTRN
jgi:hypothetical protein